RQIVADIFELQVVAPEVDEGAALGAALQALWILSCMQQGPSPISSITNEHVANRPSTRVEPQSYRFDVYREHYDRYRHAVDFLAGFY
ncbi:MAG TPA: xylulokinase, partial [Gammaproteobacteria bacterium]|nr:xylulokinase [Gammaproteobacteria bacterium]